MAVVCLNKEAIASTGMSLGEVLLMLAIHNEIDLSQAEKILVDKGFITAKRDNLFQVIGWRLTRNGSQALDNALLASLEAREEESGLKDADLASLARRLKEVFPKGKKANTNLYWTEGEALIMRRLKLFFKKYGNEYTADQIVEAAQGYVTSFNGDYRFMRVLRYFILKEEKGANGEIEGTSELLNWLSNAGQEDSNNNDWMSSVR